MTQAVQKDRGPLPAAAACKALGLPRATYYRKKAPAAPPPYRLAAEKKRPPSPRALSPQEKARALEALHDPRFSDLAPGSVVARLQEEGLYVCSERTMYRILKARGESRERRAQASHPPRKPPRLEARAPLQVWTWDITHLPLAGGGTLKLYVFIDLFSRYAVGWRLAEAERGVEAADMFGQIAARAGIDSRGLVLHADNGGPMRSKPLADMLETLHVERSHSRPRVSNDNAFSESQFKTLKYRPDYPGRFAGMQQAQAWCEAFFQWYNYEHRHSGIAMLAPADVHFGRDGALLDARHQVMLDAYRLHPERFVKGPPRRAALPETVSINPCSPGAAGKPPKGHGQAPGEGNT